MNWAGILKSLKDGLRGALLAISPLVLSGITGAATWVNVAGGIVVAILGVFANALQANATPATTGQAAWVKAVNDALYGVLIMAQSVIQTGIGDGQKVSYIVVGLLVGALGVLANVLHDDYSTSTGVMKIVKDVVISALNVIVPALQAGMSAGTSLVVILAGAGHAIFSAVANTLEADIFGTDNAAPAPAAKPAGT
jgi:hypothetical protein